MVILSLLPLRARKSDEYRYHDSWKSDNFRKEALKKRSKELILKMDAIRIKSDNFTRDNIGKINDRMAP